GGVRAGGRGGGRGGGSRRNGVAGQRSGGGRASEVGVGCRRSDRRRRVGIKKRTGWLRGQTTRPAIIGAPTGARNAGTGAPTGDQSTRQSLHRIPPLCVKTQQRAQRASHLPDRSRSSALGECTLYWAFETGPRSKHGV